MELGREHGEIVYGRKGVWRPLVRFKGIPAHSGNDYEKGASAILKLARKTVDMFGITDLAAGTTCNVGVIQGGSVPNIMAENASARLDIRFKTVAELEKARARLTEICSHNYDERTSTDIIESGPSDCMPPFEKTDGGLPAAHRQAVKILLQSKKKLQKPDFPHPKARLLLLHASDKVSLFSPLPFRKQQSGQSQRDACQRRRRQPLA